MDKEKLLPELEKEFYERFTKPVNTNNGIERYLDLDYQTKPQEILDWVDDNFVPVDLLISLGDSQPVQTAKTKPFTDEFANILLINALRQLTLEQRHTLTMSLVERDIRIKKRDIKKLWIARDQDGELSLFEYKPSATGVRNSKWYWSNRQGKNIRIPNNWFGNIKYDNSPQEIEVKLSNRC